MAYGLAVGVKLEPSHQVQFTFKEDDVRRIRERILEYQNEKPKDPDDKMDLMKRAENLVNWFGGPDENDDDKLPGFPYFVKGDPTTNPPGLCRHMGDAG